MRYQLSVTKYAQAEETEAYNFYEDRKPGLGERWLAELKNTYGKIASNPLQYGYLYSSRILRSVKVNDFPFLVIYVISNNNVSIVSVRNTYRKPVTQ